MDIIEQIKHLWWNWDSWACILMKIIKGKWIFKMLFLSNVDYPIWRISFWLLCCLKAYCLKAQINAWVAFLFFYLSEIARSLSSMYNSRIFINVYYEYFCKLMWLSAISPHVLELLDVTRQCKLRFYDINMNFIKQNIHVLCNMKSYECHLMKIIKG